MKMRLALVTSILIFLAAVWILNQDSAALEVQIQLSSNPYPLTIGPTNMLINLVDVDEAPVTGALVEAEAVMDHEGSIPIYGRAVELSDGQYSLPLTWSMMGRWKLAVSVNVPQEQFKTQEEYDVFVYPMTPAVDVNHAAFTSVREIDQLVSADPEKELWIVIPQGTLSMMETGHFDDVIPVDIRLQVSGRNTIVIRNDDISDHVIGPFFIRSGETVRQTFTRPEVFQGVCSIGYSDEISIIVEE